MYTGILLHPFRVICFVKKNCTYFFSLKCRFIDRENYCNANLYAYLTQSSFKSVHRVEY